MDPRFHSAVEERRPAVRVNVDVEAACTSAELPGPFAGRIDEISASGLRLSSDQRLPLGMFIDVAFRLSDPAHRATAIIRARARVVRIVRADPSTFEYALQVADDGSKSALRQAVLRINLAATPKARELRRY